jgi:GNAT superfamily N-acetyltransferase
MSTSIPEGFRVEPADYRRDFDSLRAIRDEVFVRGQNVPLDIELDALDPLCQHVIARSEDGQAIGTGRLLPDGRIGRMAVLETWRGRGVGGVMLARLVELARARGLQQVELHSQVHAISTNATASKPMARISSKPASSTCTCAVHSPRMCPAAPPGPSCWRSRASTPRARSAWN